MLLIQDESTLPDVAFPQRFVQVVKNRYDGQLGRMELQFSRGAKIYSSRVIPSRPLDVKTLVNEPG